MGRWAQAAAHLPLKNMNRVNMALWALMSLWPSFAALKAMPCQGKKKTHTHGHARMLSAGPYLYSKGTRQPPRTPPAPPPDPIPAGPLYFFSHPTSMQTKLSPSRSMLA